MESFCCYSKCGIILAHVIVVSASAFMSGVKLGKKFNRMKQAAIPAAEASVATTPSEKTQDSQAPRLDLSHGFIRSIVYNQVIRLPSSAVCRDFVVYGVCEFVRRTQWMHRSVINIYRVSGTCKESETSRWGGRACTTLWEVRSL